MIIKRINHKKLIEQNDQISARLVKLRDNNHCRMCGKEVFGRDANCSHIIPRTHFGLRWNLDNLFCFCYHCHIYKWHNDPLEAAKFVKQELGIKGIEKLHKKDILIKCDDDFLIKWNNKLKNLYWQKTGERWK